MSDKVAQFMPPPFGAPPKPTPFEEMLNAQSRGEWTGFRHVDMDKEHAFLAKVAESGSWRPHKGEPRTPAAEAAAAWAKTGERARAALRNIARRAPERLDHMEETILEFAVEAAPGQELVLPLADAFSRLLAYGLCEYHALEATSRATPSGAKDFVIKAPPPPPPLPPSPGTASGEECGGGEGDGAAPAEAGGDSEAGGGGVVEDVGWRPRGMACVDFMTHLLSEQSENTRH